MVVAGRPGTLVEDAINDGIIEEEKNLVSKKGTINAINSQKSSVAKPQRNFSELKYFEWSWTNYKLKEFFKPLWDL